MRDGAKFRLGDLCSIIKGETPIKQAIPGRYPLVVTASERATHNKFQFDCNAVIVPLVSSTGHGHASIKRIHYQEGKFALGSILCAVVPKDEKKINAQFLYIYFSYFKDQLIVPLMKGSANVSLSLSSLAELKVIVPSMDVQQRVIQLAKNDKLTKPLELEIARQEVLLSKLRKAILQDAIQGKLTEEWRKANSDAESANKLLERIQTEKVQLGRAKKIRKEKFLPNITSTEIPFEIPKGWLWCRLGALFQSLQYGTSLKCSYDSTKNTAILRIPNISSGKLSTEDLKFTNLTQTEKEQYALKKHDILMIRSNGSRSLVGSAVHFDEESGNYGYAGYLMRLRFSKEIWAPYLVATLASCTLRDQIERPLRTTVGINNVNSTEVSNLKIPLPPFSEQVAIANRVETLMATCHKLEIEIQQSRIRAMHLLQSVLKEAFAEKEQLETSESPLQSKILTSGSLSHI